ncbi:dipeptidase [Clostridium magnum]|uniref:Membrane dipeptidase n=1 Tax=Clostridium magnum DSM 2767 TaxID=1121326 RepID=A0A161WRY4_9CLOT|nr:dipeptidase [Clostridium magnum]KZL89528.1 membrane dipeptidase [Clostridium magnum DSM 2767]SHH71426.1 membrane dipeptidase [Clostridium magnum DSM 2767]
MNFIDLHCDTIDMLLNNPGNWNLAKNNLSVDIEKMKRGNSLAQFFALYINQKKTKKPLEKCLQMLDKFYLELDRNNDSIALATNYKDLIKNKQKDKISAFLAIEGGEAINGSLYNLRNFYRLGVRLITLTWNFPNEIGFPNCRNEYVYRGLTSFGHEVVIEMNNLSMLIDVSHLSDKGFYDVARLSKKPFIASHSNSRTITNHPRNLTDEMIKILSQKGGVIGINFEKSFLGENVPAKVSDMINHIKHIKNTGGVDVISIGSDFDGIELPSEIKNIGEIDKLSSELKKNNFSEEEIEKIFYKNALRVIKDTL